MAAPPIVYRAPMRSRDDAVPDGGAVERALAIGAVGMGGRVDEEPGTLAEALVAVDAAHGERAARRLERFAALPDGTFTWTRDTDGMLWLGRIAGPWWYDVSPSARAVDLVHVRDCTWLDRPVDAVDVPAAVAATFSRGGRNGQVIHGPEVGAQTAMLWTATG